MDLLKYQPILCWVYYNPAPPRVSINTQIASKHIIPQNYHDLLYILFNEHVDVDYVLYMNLYICEENNENRCI